MVQTFFDTAWKVFALSDNKVLGSPCCPTNLQKASKKEGIFISNSWQTNYLLT